ncbi:MAG: hypothetical protein U9N35_07630 [Euryarchaeota archaeon]|nr:hypothetical protein [Euryarchaeota archaeon]
MEKYNILFDTDVLINWLAKEENLWEAPASPARCRGTPQQRVRE